MLFFFWVCAQMKRHKYCSASPWRVAKLVYRPIGSQCTWIPVLLIFPFLEKTLLVIGVKFEMHTPPLSSRIYNTLMAPNCIACFYAPFLFLEYIRFMLQVIFVSEKCERRGTCENRQLFQRTYTFELKQKMSVTASSYYLVSWRFKATSGGGSGTLSGSFKLIICYSKQWDLVT